MTDSEWNKVWSSIAAGAAKEVFREFMALAIRFDRLQAIGGQALRRFQHELELFRKPPLDRHSEVLAFVFQSAPSPRLTKYAEAGGRHSYADRVNITRYSAIRSLLNHKTQARALIKQLEGKVERAIEIAKDDLDLYLDRALILDCRSHEQEGALRQDTSPMQVASDYSTTTVLLLNMLQLDYTMQERIIGALGLETPSEILDNYCTMWTLRPYIDDDVFSQALTL